MQVALLYQNFDIVGGRETVAKELLRTTEGDLPQKLKEWTPVAAMPASELEDDGELLSLIYLATNGAHRSPWATNILAQIHSALAKEKIVAKTEGRMKKVSHTAMTPGDIVMIVRGNKKTEYYLCCAVGFEKVRDILTCSRITDSTDVQVSDVLKAERQEVAK